MCVGIEPSTLPVREDLSVDRKSIKRWIGERRWYERLLECNFLGEASGPGGAAFVVDSDDDGNGMMTQDELDDFAAVAAARASVAAGDDDVDSIPDHTSRASDDNSNKAGDQLQPLSPTGTPPEPVSEEEDSPNYAQNTKKVRRTYYHS